MSQAPGGSASKWSGSFADALQWAEASTALRGACQPVTELDLFLGTLLAHPDPDGEMRRLIGYFGLTARDLLPDDFPKVTRESLLHAAATVGTGSPASRDERVTQIIVDPHGHHLEDSIVKLQGLARFAAEHGDAFHRIEALSRVNNTTIKVLDLKIRAVREAVLAAKPPPIDLYLSSVAVVYDPE